MAEVNTWYYTVLWSCQYAIPHATLNPTIERYLGSRILGMTLTR